MKESLSSEHGAELSVYSVEEFLNRSRVSDEGDGERDTLGRDGAVSGLSCVGNPFDEVLRVCEVSRRHSISYR